jgi:hypothetical protein
MEKFMLVVREDLQMLKKLTEDERKFCVQELSSWVRELAASGNYVEGKPLLMEGKYVTKDHILSDGPFIEAKEGVSGYLIINAENLNQAASIAQSCPYVISGEMVIEVRPFMNVDNE